MKKLILLPLAFILFAAPMADNLIDEGFEGGSLPGSWQIWEEAPADYSWYFNNLSPHTGTYAANRYWDNYDVDSWLVTPTLDVSGYENLYFSCWYYGYHVSDYTYTGFKVATVSSPGSGDFTQVFEFGPPPESSYEEKTADLSAYDGETDLTLAFHYTGQSGHGVYLDDVLVTGDPASGIESASLGEIKAIYR